MVKIKLLRVNKDLSQAQLSLLAKIPAYKISMLERGRYIPTEEELNRLSLALTGDQDKLRKVAEIPAM